ncbi:type II toxin-antitoxin system PemK/MazF family toxin [Cellulomonas flavigena]|uniref:type II toxin-antitoxin system PemK/MazF family toxin n=1 Tax=Cellulomonas flavigena TaxID=1711 RepID=UPI00019E28DE|nr:type II toxin-antitoxin system PemK/MazF family toxin [Cellulomonas flavigena]
MPTTPDDVLTLLVQPEVVLGLAAVLLLLVVRGRSRRRRARAAARAREASRAPYAGEIWFADVPYEDGTGSKDRPVLVLRVRDRTCEVARFTSQDRGTRRDHVALPPGFPGLSRASWIDLRPRELPIAALRRRAGVPGPALVTWYRQVSAQRGLPGDAA